MENHNAIITVRLEGIANVMLSSAAFKLFPLNATHNRLSEALTRDEKLALSREQLQTQLEAGRWTVDTEMLGIDGINFVSAIAVGLEWDA